MNKLRTSNIYIPLFSYLVSEFFSYRFDSIRFCQKLEMARIAGAATKHLIQMSHFITTGGHKTSRIIKSLSEKQENTFFE